MKYMASTPHVYTLEGVWNSILQNPHAACELVKTVNTHTYTGYSVPLYTL